MDLAKWNLAEKGLKGHALHMKPMEALVPEESPSQTERFRTIPVMEWDLNRPRELRRQVLFELLPPAIAG